MAAPLPVVGRGSPQVMTPGLDIVEFGVVALWRLTPTGRTCRSTPCPPHRGARG